MRRQIWRWGLGLALAVLAGVLAAWPHGPDPCDREVRVADLAAVRAALHAAMPPECLERGVRVRVVPETPARH